MPTGADLQPLVEASLAAAEQRALDESDDSEGAELSPTPPSPVAPQLELLPSEATAPRRRGEAGRDSPRSAPAPLLLTQLELVTRPSRVARPTPASSLPAFEPKQQPPAAATPRATGHPTAQPGLFPPARLPVASGAPPSAHHPPSPSPLTQLELATWPSRAALPTPASSPPAFELKQQPSAAATPQATGRPPAQLSLLSSAHSPVRSGAPPSAHHLLFEPLEPSLSHPPSEPPDAALPAPTSLKHADRRHKASQARKKAKRARKAASGTGSFGYRVKASALPVLEGLAAASVKVSIAKAAVASPGAYVGKRSSAPRRAAAPTLSHLLKAGFLYHPWDGR